MRNKSIVICKKNFHKLNSLGNYHFFLKGEEFEIELLDLDYFCILINIEEEVYIRIFESEFKEYFFTQKELRKAKIKKINEI